MYPNEPLEQHSGRNPRIEPIQPIEPVAPIDQTTAAPVAPVAKNTPTQQSRDKEDIDFVFKKIDKGANASEVKESLKAKYGDARADELLDIARKKTDDDIEVEKANKAQAQKDEVKAQQESGSSTNKLFDGMFDHFNPKPDVNLKDILNYGQFIEEGRKSYTSDQLTDVLKARNNPFTLEQTRDFTQFIKEGRSAGLPDEQIIEAIQNSHSKSNKDKLLSLYEGPGQAVANMVKEGLTTEMTALEGKIGKATRITSLVDNVRSRHYSTLKDALGYFSSDMAIEAEQDLISVNQSVVDELLEKGHDAFLQQGTHQILLRDEKGNVHALEPSMMDTLFDSKFEIGGAVVGAAKLGTKWGKKGGPWAAAAGTLIGGGGGAAIGAGLDYVVNDAFALGNDMSYKLMTTKMIDAGLADSVITGATGVTWHVAGKPLVKLSMKILDHIYQTGVHGNFKGMYRVLKNNFYMDTKKTIAGFKTWKRLEGITDETPVYRTNMLGHKVVANDSWLMLKYFAGTKYPGTMFTQAGGAEAVNIVQKGHQRMKDVHETIKDVANKDTIDSTLKTLDDYDKYTNKAYGDIKNTMIDVVDGANWKFKIESLGIKAANKRIKNYLSDPYDLSLFRAVGLTMTKNSKNRSMEGLLQLRETVNDLKDKLVSKKAQDEAKYLINSIDIQTQAALTKVLPDGQGSRLFDEYETTKLEVSEMLEMKSTKLHKYLMANTETPEPQIIDRLAKSMLKGKGDYPKLMAKLTQKKQYEVEGAIVKRIMDNATVGKTEKLGAINFPVAYEKLIERKFKDPLLNKYIKVIKEYSDTYHIDVANAVGLMGVKTSKPKAYLAGSLPARAQFAAVNFATNYLRRFLPGAQADREAFARALTVFQDPVDFRSPKALFDDIAKRLPLKDKMEFQKLSEKYLLTDLPDPMEAIYQETVKVPKKPKKVIEDTPEVALSKQVLEELKKINATPTNPRNKRGRY